MVSASFNAWGDDSIANPIPNFHSVDGHVFRGAEPHADGMIYLHQIKIRTDIDLEAFPDPVGDEKAEALPDINFDHQPILALPSVLGYLAPVNDGEVDKILATMADPASWPVFVHCQHGEDRTGMIVALYRVMTGEKTPQDAYNEALSYGIHPYYTNFVRYYQQKSQRLAQ